MHTPLLITPAWILGELLPSLRGIDHLIAEHCVRRTCEQFAQGPYTVTVSDEARTRRPTLRVTDLTLDWLNRPPCPTPNNSILITPVGPNLLQSKELLPTNQPHPVLM